MHRNVIINLVQSASFRKENSEKRKIKKNNKLLSKIALNLCNFINKPKYQIPLYPKNIEKDMVDSRGVGQNTGQLYFLKHFKDEFFKASGNVKTQPFLWRKPRWRPTRDADDKFFMITILIRGQNYGGT